MAKSRGSNEIFIPDVIFPSDNRWGIPLLDLSMQADMLVVPFAAWGTMRRVSKMTGTYHFYVEDYRFDNIWKHPEQVVNTACSAIVEPNYSVYTDMPAALAIWMIYKKRWLAKMWQTFGIKTIVDLNISHKHEEFALLGVPKGWKAYATRAYSDRLYDINIEYNAAIKHAETNNILFIVYGGGNSARELAESKSWIWYPDQQTAMKEVVHG